MNSKIYRQTDTRWASKPYPVKASSFGGNGCGCVSCLHLIIEIDKYKNWTPENLRPWMVEQGFAVTNKGTLWAGIPKTLQHFGFGVINHATMSDIFTTLNKRKKEGKACLGVILFDSGTRGGITWTSGGHFVAFTDYKYENSKHYFYTKDSGGRCNDGWHCYETQMKGLIPQIWSALLPENAKQVTTQTKTTATTTTNSTQIAVSGKFDKASVKAWQKFCGTTQDGVISGQLSNYKDNHKGFSGTIKYGSGGSVCVKAWQKYLKLSNPDGYLGVNTIKATQKLIGTTADGYWGVNTSKAMQKWLNDKLSKASKTTTATTTTTKNTNTTATTTKKTLKGIDISTWQGKISQANFKRAINDGVKFVILRIGYTGSSSNKPTLDDVFENNYNNAVKAGLPVGVYYYSLATTDAKAKEEADWVVKQLKGKKISYPVYIDVEDPNKQAKCSKKTLASVCDVFCKTVKSAGYKAGVYASLNWFNNKIGNITADHTKWVAQYYSKCEYKGAYDMWQYTSSGKVDGLSGKIDMNYYYQK